MYAWRGMGKLTSGIWSAYLYFFFYFPILGLRWVVSLKRCGDETLNLGIYGFRVKYWAQLITTSIVSYLYISFLPVICLMQYIHFVDNIRVPCQILYCYVLTRVSNVGQLGLCLFWWEWTVRWLKHVSALFYQVMQALGNANMRNTQQCSFISRLE